MKSVARRMLAEAKRPPVLACGGLIAIAAGIAANALFLQPSLHPAPLFSTRIVSPSLAPTRSDARTLAIQAELKRSGHYAGPVDGIAGPQTAAAFAAFEAEHGRAPTGEAQAEPDLLAALLDDAPAETASAARAPAPDPQLAAVQSALARAAYGPLKADGVMGPQTREAISRFQSDRGLSVTGAVDAALLAELKVAGALEGD